MTHTYDVIIIGSGMAGLAASIELATAGYKVAVVERGSAPGGKMRRVYVANKPMDAGPTVFTMRWVFDEILAKAGTCLEDLITFNRAELLARHTWDNKSNGTYFDLFADIERAADEIAIFFGPDEARGYRAFCKEARAMFQTLRDTHMAAQRPSLLGLPLRVGLSKLGDLSKTQPFATMWQALGKHFKDPRLQQLFGRYATYCGSSPYQAVATLMLVAHVEQDGVWVINGGMHELARGLAKTAEKAGVTFYFDSPVDRITIENGAVSGVRIHDRGLLASKNVIAGADVAAIASGLFGPDVQPAVSTVKPDERSLSALTWNATAKTSGFPLAHHNVFFSDNYQAEFDELFDFGDVPTKPTVYICAQDRTDLGGNAAPDLERLLILINAPATGDHEDYDAEMVEEYRQRTFGLLSRCGLEIEPTENGLMATTPADFDRLFPATGGALYGASAHNWYAPFKRPQAKTKIKGLYLASGSAHPGPGIPMAALSGRLAAEAIIADRPAFYMPNTNAKTA